MDKNGMVFYGGTQFKSQVGTCYHQITSCTSADFTCQAKSMISMRIPWLHELLDEHSNKAGGHKQRAIHKLVAALDSDISNQMKFIESA
uniref:Uncharacterized protein n=1 Tax=Arundo donax TaxID=35708 RepID=A0A0A9BBZ2_ARUDO